MEDKKKRTSKKRRRIRWGRMTVFLFFLFGIAYGLGWCVYGLYGVGQEVYREYNAIVDEWEGRRVLPAKFQDARFASFTNILLLGIDDGDAGKEFSGRRSDALFVVTVNHDSSFIHLLSIPRDTKVKIPGRRLEERINQAYYYGGTQLAVRTVEELLQLPLHHFLVVDMKAFTEIVDVLGGIYLYVENDMDYDDSYAGLAIHLKKGYQYLSGAEALQYIRYRSDELGDIGRVQRQQKFFKKLYADLLKVDTITKLPEIMEIINRRVKTSMAVLDTAHVAKALSGCKEDSISAEMLPGSTVRENDSSYWLVDQEKTNLLIEGIFKETIPQPEQAAEAKE